MSQVRPEIPSFEHFQSVTDNMRDIFCERNGLASGLTKDKNKLTFFVIFDALHMRKIYPTIAHISLYKKGRKFMQQFPIAMGDDNLL